MSIKGQSHSVVLGKGHPDFKIKTCFAQKLLGHIEGQVHSLIFAKGHSNCKIQTCFSQMLLYSSTKKIVQMMTLIFFTTRSYMKNDNTYDFMVSF